MFGMRFDFRVAEGGVPRPELYRAALDMAAWAETRGGNSVAVTEHHSDADGYLPSPLIMAAAFAARTEIAVVSVAIFQLPLYNPVRLAEEICVLDNLSNGRIRYIGGIGYVPYEYEMHGVDYHRRGKISEEYLTILLKAVTGEEFVHEGRRIKVTPPPVTPGGPSIGWGGGSAPAARRAGRFGMDFLGQRSDPVLREAYDQGCREGGHEPGNFYMSRAEDPAVIFVAEDVDAAWEEIGPYLMNDVLGYAQWYEGKDGERGDSNSISFAQTWQELRAENRSHVILSVDEAVRLVQAGGRLSLHPLIGGLPPEIAWRYLETVAEKVVPAAKA